MNEGYLATSGFPVLSRLLDRDEMWDAVRDFDALMKGAEARVRSADVSAESGKAAKLLLDFARSHFHLLLVGEYKIKEIGRGIVAALDAYNETVLFNLARAFIEHTAALAFQVAALEKAVSEIPKKPDIKSLEATISRHRQAVQTLYYNERASVHVNDMVEALTKHYESAKRDYDDFCEFVHPNYGSNRLVSSGELGAGKIGVNAEKLAPELGRVHEIIERCAQLAGDDLNKKASYLLIRISGWTEVACQNGIKLSQVFSVRSATSGDGRTKETAIFFKKARTHQEAVEAFYSYLKSENIVILNRRTAAVEDQFIFDVVSTSKGTLWVKYRMTT
jgi:hypothetical protein